MASDAEKTKKAKAPRKRVAFGKFREDNQPWFVVDGSLPEERWIWEIRKCYKGKESMQSDYYSRVFCRVISPYTGSRGELGDVYVLDIPGFWKAYDKALEELGGER